METLWKIVFYILNFTVYLFLIWWVVNKYLVATMAAASLGYWIFFFVLIFLAVSSVGYWVAHYFWDSGYWGMFFKNVGMFVLALFVLSMKETVESSFSDFCKRGTVFEWNMNISTPKYYSIVNIKTELLYSNGSKNVYEEYIYAGMDWGSSQTSRGSSHKQEIPTRLHTKWLSYREGETGQLYEGTFDLPYDTILNLFRNGYIYQYTDSEIVKEEYTGISVGLAPGGVVALWVSGSHRRVQVGCWVADKLSADDELFASRGGQKKWVKQLRSTDSYDNIPDHIKNKPIGQWEKYNQTYPYRYNVSFVDGEPESLLIETRYYNGERFQSGIDDTVIRSKACPKKIVLIWKKGDDEYFACIQFEETYLFRSFEQMVVAPSFELCFAVNKESNFIDCFLQGDGKRIELPDEYRKIKIFRNHKMVYGNYLQEGIEFWGEGYLY